MKREELQNLSLSRLAEGAVELSFLEVLSDEILPNIFDFNRDPKGMRSVTITVKFKPTIDRNGNITGADIMVDDPKCKLVPRRPVLSHVLLGKIGNQYQAKEIRQLEIQEEVAEELQELGKQGVKLEVIR